MRGVPVLAVWMVFGLVLERAEPQELPFRPFRESVNIAVDNDAAKALLTIDDRWQAGRWQDALEDLIALAETRGASIVQLDRDGPGSVSRYVPVSNAVERWLASLPPEGLALYRRRVDPRAERLWTDWQRTGNETRLQQLVEQLFYSSFGDEAVWELGQRCWSRGDLGAARGHWSQLLPPDVDLGDQPTRRYPDPAFAAGDVAARVVLCDILSASARAERSRTEFERRFPAAEGRLGERQGLWTELLAEVARTESEQHPPWGGTEVPTFAGSPGRNMISSRRIDLGSELWSAPLSAPVVTRLPQATVYPPAWPLAFAPVVSDDIVYVNDGSQIWAWNLYSGRPAWDQELVGSARVYPLAAPDESLPPRRPVSGSPLWTVTVGNGRLYARMGSVVTTPAPLELREQLSELICLDVAAGEGRLLWSLTDKDISERIQSGDIDAPSWSWEGTPLQLGTRLYAALSRRRPQLEWSVVCLDAETGMLLWHRPIGMSLPAPPDHENLASHLLLSAAGDRLILSTNWGAIMAVQAHDGQLAWAVTYESQAARPPLPPDSVPVAATPCLATAERVFAAPADSDSLFCLDTRTGALCWRQLTARTTRHLLGVLQGRVFTSGDDLRCHDAATGAVLWRIPPAEPEDRGFGRGWMAGDAVYWPTRESILVVEQSTGRLLQEKPLLTPDSRRFGGHLTVAGDVLLVASPDRITAYGEYSRLREASEGWLSLHPHDSRSQLRLGDLLVARNETVEALRTWQSAWENASSPLALDARSRAAAERRLIAATLSPPLEHAPRLRERFAVAQAWPMENARRRRLLALELRCAEGPDWRVSVLHRWLQNLEGHASAGPVRPAALRMEAELQAIREQEGEAVFARHDRAAQRRRETLADVTDAAAWRRLQREFPTSPAARPAGSFDLVDTQSVAFAATAVESLTGAGTDVPSVFWAQSWEEPLPEGARVVFPSGEPAAGSAGMVLVLTDRLTAYDRRNGRPRWSVPCSRPLICAEFGPRTLLLATDAECLAVQPVDGRVLWRRGIGSLLSFETPRSHATEIRVGVTKHGLAVCQPQTAVMVIEETSGEVRWFHDLSVAPWGGTVAIGDQWIVGQRLQSGSGELLDASSGKRITLLPGEQHPWLREPVCLSQKGELATVHDDRSLSVWSSAGERRWEYQGVVAFAHVDPWLVSQESGWYAVIDGSRVVRIDESGRPLNSVSLGTYPVRSRQNPVVLAEDCWIVAGEDAARGVDPRSGRGLWRQLLQATEPPRLLAIPETQDCVVLSHVSMSGTTLAEVFDGRSGHPRQAIAIAGRVVDAAADSTGWVVATSDRLRAFQRRAAFSPGLQSATR